MFTLSQFKGKYAKVKGTDSYTNISALFIFYFPALLRIFYTLRIPHEFITLTSIGCGIGAAAMIYQGNYITGAILFHLKDVTDACDGALARITGRGHRIGRFLDTLGDFVSITAVFGVVGIREYILNGGTEIIVLTIITIFSIFLQCSYFNYYQLKYIEYSKTKTLISRTDERIIESDKRYFHTPTLNGILFILQSLYHIIFGWQDKFMRWIDEQSQKSALEKTNQPKSEWIHRWYHNKTFMVMVSLLCFGTDIFIMAICLLIGKPILSFYIISVGLNIYWVILIIIKAKGYN